ncbi:hypothetical protein P7K49_034377 [Saguinus oedipus]|uniref:Uncharacterized protein n=1 Tax=Saguinus oedipus TaxID=9490 RepID=A0ABQ9TVE2_SAGOE|nr:hypothetical protein P7K49_034377 [Saguinus oedipus]
MRNLKEAITAYGVDGDIKEGDGDSSEVGDKTEGEESHKRTEDHIREEMHYRQEDNTRRAAEAPRPQIAQYLYSTSPTLGPSPIETFQAGAPPDRPRAVRRRTTVRLRAGGGQACAFLIGLAAR